MKKFFKISLIVVLVLCVLTVSGGLIAYASITKNAEIHNNLLPQSQISSVFYDSNGNTIEGTTSDFVTYKDLPKNLINALIALEDKRFYKHKGVDYIRTTGAVFNNIKNGGFYEGGSTITQQLIKNTHLSQDKTVKRKLNEIKLAKKLEKQYSKESILEMYFNAVYFGSGMYGVNAAAKGLFNKSVPSLSLSECAALVAILKNPSKYSPLVSKENSKNRRNLVLSLMHEQGYISANDKSAAQSEDIILDDGATFSNTQSYMLSAAYEAAKILNISVQTLMASDYTVKTYLDIVQQQALTEVIGNPEYYLVNGNGVRGEGVGIILDNETAGVSAYFANKKRNIYELSRPYGSAAKPLLVYAPSFEYALITAATPVLDEKTDFSGYMPSNYGDSYLGWTDIRTSIKQSSNVVAVKTYNMLGFDKCAEFAGKIGIDILPSDNNATLALGNLSGNNDFLDVLGGYCMLSNGGEYIAPSFVNEIYDKSGNLVYARDNSKNRVISEENAFLLTDILIDTAAEGTAKGLNALYFEVASKTGTVGNANGNTDAYSISYTTKNTMLVWHGNSSGNGYYDLNEKETGGSYATRSARDIYKKIYEDKPAAFSVPDGVISENIDAYAQKRLHKLLLSTENTPEEYIKTELFSADNAPLEYSSCFDKFGVNDVKVNVVDGNVGFTFSATPYINYDVVRVVKGKEKVIATLKGSKNDDVLTYIDKKAPYGKFVKYYIKPYFYNRFGKKIVGNAHETDNFFLNYYDFYED